MRVSTKGRYTLRVMLDLAQHYGGDYISLKDIATRQEISKNYLDQIMMILKGDNFFKASRGYKGGYKLAKEPKNYTIGEILRVAEGSIAPVACLEDGGADCARSAACISIHVWAGLEKAMNSYLDNLTLQDILDKYGVTENCQNPENLVFEI